MRYKLILDDVPPSLNQLIFNAKRHWGMYASIKKAWKKFVNGALPYNAVPFTKPVKITITYYYNDKRARDLDNQTGKLILDGLTKKDNPEKYIIYDDSEVWIKELVIRLRKGKTKYTKVVINDK